MSPLLGRFLVSFNLQSAICGLQSANVVHRLWLTLPFHLSIAVYKIHGCFPCPATAELFRNHISICNSKNYFSCKPMLFLIISCQICNRQTSIAEVLVGVEIACHRAPWNTSVSSSWRMSIFSRCTTPPPPPPQKWLHSLISNKPLKHIWVPNEDRPWRFRQKNKKYFI